MGKLAKIQNRLANSVDPDETARYEPSHLDLQCLHEYWLWSAGVNGSSFQEVHSRGLNTQSD